MSIILIECLASDCEGLLGHLLPRLRLRQTNDDTCPIIEPFGDGTTSGCTSFISRPVDFRPSSAKFVAAYADLNHFKAYNDYYGYWRGDEMTRLAARVISAHRDPQRDFVGHIGGDDFIVLFQSGDWQACCECIVLDFNTRAPRSVLEWCRWHRGSTRPRNRSRRPRRPRSVWPNNRRRDGIGSMYVSLTRKVLPLDHATGRTVCYRIVTKD
jgi:hypothetical protein